MEEDKQLAKALLKKAMGYSVNEVVEEYTGEDDKNMKLVKKKVTKKHIPPDIPAARALLELFYQDSSDKFKNMSDEDLYRERDRLVELLQQSKEEKDGREDEAQE